MHNNILRQIEHPKFAGNAFLEHIDLNALLGTYF